MVQLLHVWNRSCLYLITSTGSPKFTIDLAATPKHADFPSSHLANLLLPEPNTPNFSTSRCRPSGGSHLSAAPRSASPRAHRSGGEARALVPQEVRDGGGTAAGVPAPPRRRSAVPPPNPGPWDLPPRSRALLQSRPPGLRPRPQDPLGASRTAPARGPIPARSPALASPLRRRRRRRRERARTHARTYCVTSQPLMGSAPPHRAFQGGVPLRLHPPSNRSYVCASWFGSEGTRSLSRVCWVSTPFILSHDVFQLLSPKDICVLFNIGCLKDCYLHCITVRQRTPVKFCEV